MSTEAQLALEFFKLGNGVIAFYVIQTILFVNAIYKENVLLIALCARRQLASNVTWGIATTYMTTLIVFEICEIWLRLSAAESRTVLTISIISAIGRVSLVFFLAWACSKLISDYLVDPCTQRAENTSLN